MHVSEDPWISRTNEYLPCGLSDTPDAHLEAFSKILTLKTASLVILLRHRI